MGVLSGSNQEAAVGGGGAGRWASEVVVVKAVVETGEGELGQG